MTTRKHLGVLTAAMAAGFAGAAPAQAAQIAFYPFNGTTVASSSDTEPNSLAGDFVDAGGFVRSSSSNTWVQTYDKILSTTEAQATGANTDYSSFTITPAPNYKLNLTELLFTTQVNSSTANTLLGGTFLIRSSADGFASNIATFQQLDTGVTAATQRNIPLTGPAFQGLTAPITFRVYVYKEVSSTTSGDGMRIDNVTLNGDVVSVPEPAALFAMTGGALLLLRRRSAPERQAQPGRKR